jgi:putative ubiquitin-RnfH superfamily antitoxin RatB of RatAB toxin-antitoxin module
MDRADRADPAPQEGATLRVEVAYAAAPHDVDLSELRLAQGATVAEALQASGLVPRRGLDAASLDLGVWGEACPRERLLRDGDRVEVYRPLRADPKEARRQRAPAAVKSARGRR